MKVINGTGEIDVKYIADPKENIIDLSTSLLGIFKTRHFKYKITRVGQSRGFLCDWDFESFCPSPKYPIDFEIMKGYNCWSLAISEIDNQSLTFTTGAGKTFKEHTVVCKIKHTPTFSNFWHFSVRWFMDGTDVFELSRSGAISNNHISKLSRQVRLFLKEFISLSVPNTKSLEKNLYVVGEH